MSIVEPRSAVVTLYQGDDLDRIRFIEQKYKAALEAEKGTTALMGEVAESVTLAQQHAEEVAEASARAINVRMKAIRRSAYRELAEQHPPRTGKDVDPTVVVADAKMNVNSETFRVALVPIALEEITTGDETTAWDDLDEDDRAEFLDTITEADFELLFMHAYGLMNNFVSSPKALTSPALQGTQRSSAN